MVKVIKKDIQGIPYTVRNTLKKRRVQITVYPGGEVIVSKSPSISLQAAEDMVHEKFQWIQKKVDEQKKRPTKLLSHYSIKDFKENKEKARVLVHNRLTYFNKFYNYKIGRVAIRNQKSRWGSCSRKRNLNFNYKIVFLPQELADYIIIHELCHCEQMNHSHNFWDLVAKTAPNHKDLRSQLKCY